MKKSTQNRLRVGAALALVFWIISSTFYWFAIGPGSEGLGAFAVRVALVLLAGLSSVLVFWVFPIYMVIALMKLRDQRRHAIEELGDDNVVLADPEGERKLHDYLTALTSLEARIGLVQQPDPWVPPEQRPPKDARPHRVRLSAMGWSVFWYTVAGGVTVGVVSAYAHGLGATSEKMAGLIQFVVAGLVGGVLALPLAAILALVFGKTESKDDARGSSSETA